MGRFGDVVIWRCGDVVASEFWLLDPYPSFIRVDPCSSVDSMPRHFEQKRDHRFIKNPLGPPSFWRNGVGLERDLVKVARAECPVAKTARL